MPTTFKLYADKMGATDPSSYIGRDGDIFYNPDTGSLRRSDGTTPGGIAITGGGGGGINDVVEDTTPQLGGPLDINGQQITGSLIPSANTTYDIGTEENSWRDLYLAGNTIYLGGVQLSASGGKIDLPAGSTIGGAAADPVTPGIAATISEDATVPVNLTPDFQGGIKTVLIEEPNPGIPIQVDGNLNVNNSISVVGTVDLPGSALTANSVTSSFTSAGALTVTSLNTHTVQGGTGTLALTSEIPAIGTEAYDQFGTSLSYNPGAQIAHNNYLEDEAGTNDIEASVTVTSGFTRIKVELDASVINVTDATTEQPINLVRIINGGSGTTVKQFIFPAGNTFFGSQYFTFVDTHGASAGDTVAYKLLVDNSAYTITDNARIQFGICGDTLYIKEIA